MGYDFIKSSFVNSWPALAIVCVALIAIRVAYLSHHRGHFHFYNEFWMLVSVIYLLLLYDMLTRVDINSTSGVNLIPFKEIFRYDIHSKSFYYLILGNIAIFIPFGYLVAYYAKPKKIWSNLLTGIVVSGTIEFVQLQIGRSYDIDDIILNTLGCVLGYFIYVGLVAIDRRLPNLLKSNLLKNLICIIITICIGLYIWKAAGL